MAKKPIIVIDFAVKPEGGTAGKADKNPSASQRKGRIGKKLAVKPKR